MKYLISACLIGEDVKYNGKNNLNEIAKKLHDKGLAVSVCPEVLGGLPIPRITAERVGDKVINKEGFDVTREFTIGAEKTLEIALNNNVEIAILQSRSPSCGSKQIYDGTHQGVLIDGEGLTTKLLRENGIKVITVEEYVNTYYKEDFEK